MTKECGSLHYVHTHHYFIETFNFISFDGPIMFHGKTGKHLCRICTETIDILSINVKRKHVFYLYIVIAML